MNKFKKIYLPHKELISVIFLIISFLLLLFAEQQGRPFVFQWLITILAISLFGKIFFSKTLKNLNFMDGNFSFSFSISMAILFLCNWILLSIKPIFGLQIKNISFLLNLLVMFCIVIAKFLINKLLKKEKQKETNNLLLKFNKKIKQDFFNFLFGFSIFALLFSIAYWVKGFNADVYSTEKFMDFGFMQTMYRQQSYPPNDIWFSNTPLNYYYLGQAYSVFMCNLSFVTPEYGYNLMLCTLFAMLFVLSFSFVESLLSRTKNNKKRHQILGGIFAGLMTTFAGNGHWIIYGIILQIKNILLNIPNDYWFPDSTRYIGYNPDVADKTIHEFPSYSFILGDLHAHVCNVLFTIPLLILVVDYSLSLKNNNTKIKKDSVLNFIQEHLLNTNVLLIGMFLGLFQGVNYWDFPIYFVIAGAIILFSWYKKYGFSIINTIKVLGLGGYMLLIATIVIYPFNKYFEKMVSEIKLCKNHTPLYQLIILWGIPIIIVIIYFAYLINSYINENKLNNLNLDIETSKQTLTSNKIQTKKSVKFFNNISKFLNKLCVEDIIFVTLSLCAIGLVIVPEVVYVKDIYGDAYARSNTMFKLTYQAFILFGLVIGYVIGILFNEKSLIKIEKLYLIKYENKQEQVMNKKIKISYPWTSIGIVTFSFVLLLSGYTIWSTKVWFGNIFDLTQREGISATNFLYSHQDFIDDIGAIDYINKNDNRKLINIVEATGISYTSDCKLSTFTGANTIMGWHTHELLWKNNEELINNRTLEVENFYKNGNVEYCKNFIDKYNVDYIFIGTVEKEKYDIDINMLINLGEVVWQNNEKELYLIKINN